MTEEPRDQSNEQIGGPGSSGLPKDLENQVLDALADPSAEGTQRIKDLCQHHPEHTSKIRSMVEAHADAQRKLEDQVETQDAPRAEHSAPERIGPYRILDILGEGAMGTVYLAEQKGPVRRRVALKLTKFGIASKEQRARFDLERQALAVMNHEAIAKVFEAGTTEHGQPYFVMELVEGKALNTYCDDHRLSLRERIELFQKICAGVQHAHQKGVLHRDLKPGNILVSRKGDEHMPKIIDFGVARATNHQLVNRTIFTQEGVMVGTPEYMSPEQASGNALELDTRTDVYSLGVILYELLSGELPFPGEELRKAGLLEIQRKIREEEPPKPSTRISTAGELATTSARTRRTTVRALVSELRGDLDWIVLKAMSKEPERRYEAAAGIAADLQRHVDHEPVAAGPPSAAYRLKKLVRRYRIQVVAAAAVVAVLVAGILAFAIENRRARENEAVAVVVSEALKSSIQRYNVLAVARRLEAIKLKVKELGCAWPDNITGLGNWLKEGEALLEARRSVESVANETKEILAVFERETNRTSARSPHRPVEAVGFSSFARAWADSGLDPRLASRLDSKLLDAIRVAESEDALRFLHELLCALVQDLHRFEPVVVRIRNSLAWAEGVDGLTIQRYRHRWGEARTAILKADGKVASLLYGEGRIDLAPQLGLVPIGMNPVTKLWEFYHLRSAWDHKGDVAPQDLAIPSDVDYDEQGRLPVTDATGIVFVLIPGGTFWMGSQRKDPDGPNYDPESEHLSPHQETVAPFFLARYELTQGQWLRIATLPNPSKYPAGAKAGERNVAVTLVHPVEHAEWATCRDLLLQHALTLPTEVQWEYACRAGTATPWWPGSEADLDGAANLADKSSESMQFITNAGSTTVPWDDGFAIHAPVGSFHDNGFGLFDVHGNVWEWCADTPVAEVAPAGTSGAVLRGGGFDSGSHRAKSATRNLDVFPVFSFPVGVRPARALLP